MNIDQGASSADEHKVKERVAQFFQCEFNEHYPENIRISAGEHIVGKDEHRTKYLADVVMECPDRRIAVECKGYKGDIRDGIGQAVMYAAFGYEPAIAYHVNDEPCEYIVAAKKCNISVINPDTLEYEYKAVN